MFYVSPEGGRYYLGRAFNYGNLQYTAAGATADTFTSLGFTEITPDPMPDPRFYIFTGPDNTGKIETTAKDCEELKKQYIALTIRRCHDILLSTDWMLTRAGEVSRDVTFVVPQAVTNHRDNVREVCEANITALMACSTVEELQQAVDNPQKTAEFDLDAYMTVEFIAFGSVDPGASGASGGY